jgi:hypothetical protein
MTIAECLDWEAPALQGIDFAVPLAAFYRTG